MADPAAKALASPQEFAAVMRRMYPALAAEPDDNKLTQAVLKVQPAFRQHVVDPLGVKQAGTPLNTVDGIAFF